MDHSGFDNLRSDIPGLAWPPLVEGAGALLQAYVARLGQTEWLPAAEIAQHQRGQLALLAQHCVAHSPHFALRMREAGLAPGDLAQPGGLERLTPLSRRDLQSAPGVFCDHVPERHLPVGLSQTSGSTGEPVTVRRTALAAQIAQALGHPFAIDFTYYRDKLPPGPSGKSEEFVCLI